jgi:hypothetical protein
MTDVAQIMYFISGYLIAGMHFAWGMSRLPKSTFEHLIPPTWGLSLLCVFLIGPFWPIYVLMFVGNHIFNNFLGDQTND